MTTLSLEAVDLIRGGLHSLKAGGEEGHTGDVYWNNDASQRCAWGHIILAAYPDHSLGDLDALGICRMSPVGCEVDAAYEEMFTHSIDWASEHGGYAYAVACLEALLLDAVAADERIEVRNAR